MSSHRSKTPSQRVADRIKRLAGVKLMVPIRHVRQRLRDKGITFQRYEAGHGQSIGYPHGCIRVYGLKYPLAYSLKLTPTIGHAVARQADKVIGDHERLAKRWTRSIG